MEPVQPSNAPDTNPKPEEQVTPPQPLVQPEIPAPALSSPSSAASNPAPAPDVTARPDAANTTPEQTVQPLAPNPAPINNTAQPTIVVGGMDPTVSVSAQPYQATAAAKGSNKALKGALIGLAAVVLLAGGYAGYYFGYKMNPSVVYSQSLSNTNKGYDALVSYLDKQSKTDYKGLTGNGTYAIDTPSFKTDGKMTFASSGSNSETTFDIGYGTGRAALDLRTIKSSGDTPDYYIKASGLSGLSSSLAAEGIDIGKIDDKWIVVDHTLIDNIAKQATRDSKQPSVPSEAQIMDAAKAVGKVNKEYVFTANKDKAIFVRKDKGTKETVDGHTVFHYKVSPLKDHMKSYVKAEHDALLSSKLGQWIRDNNVTDGINNSFDDLEKSTNNISNSDTFDVWSDVNTRLVYKVRLSDKEKPNDNYGDFGLDYKGGNAYPFFIAFHTKDGSDETTINLKLTMDSKKNNATAAFNVKSSGTDPGEFKLSAAFAPSIKQVTINKPDNAMQLADAMKQLGLEDYYNLLTDPSVYQSALTSSTSSQTTAKDSLRQTNLYSLQTNLEVFYSQNGYYPSLTDMNSEVWRKANMSSLDTEAMKDPDGNRAQLAAKPAKGVIAYQPTDNSTASCEADDTSCAKYVLTVTFDDGTTQEVSNLD